MTNGHTGRNSVRIDNHVRDQTFTSEWQIFLTISHTTSTFLSVAGGKFIADLRDFDSSHLYFDESFIFIVRSQYNLVNVAFLRVLQRNRLIFELLLLALLAEILTTTVKITENIVRHG